MKRSTTVAHSSMRFCGTIGRPMPRADCATNDIAVTETRARSSRHCTSSMSSSCCSPHVGASIAIALSTSTRMSPECTGTGNGSAGGSPGLNLPSTSSPHTLPKLTRPTSSSMSTPRYRSAPPSRSGSAISVSKAITPSRPGLKSPLIGAPRPGAPMQRRLRPWSEPPPLRSGTRSCPAPVGQISRSCYELGVNPEGLPARLEEEDVADDPYVQFAVWLDDARAALLPEPTAMVVATADAEGRPSARHVLLKGHDERGFVFFTNLSSRKAQELRANPNASLVFPWSSIRRQVIVCGSVEEVSREEAAAYFATRPRGAQLGAWASRQSAVIPSRSWLPQRGADARAEV